MKKNFSLLLKSKLILFCLTSISIHAQEIDNSKSNTNQIVTNNELKIFVIEQFSNLELNKKDTLFSNENVNIFFSKEIFKNDSIAINQERINFTFENKSAKQVEVSFDKYLKYFNRAMTSDGSQSKISLLPNQTLSMINSPFNANFYVFVKDLRGTMKAELEKVELKNIIVR